MKNWIYFISRHYKRVFLGTGSEVSEKEGTEQKNQCVQQNLDSKICYRRDQGDYFIIQRDKEQKNRGFCGPFFWRKKLFYSGKNLCLKKKGLERIWRGSKRKEIFSQKKLLESIRKRSWQGNGFICFCRGEMIWLEKGGRRRRKVKSFIGCV
ncbi:hypothetical protein PPERSA_07770 [Pseudocohnilembus persalinus]|uniref:Uncharacterized protein n=1 Tax=Pseudocohnilembus persalinus TaxID=266149 RepID=A0A0V0R9R3_PSEPJ|nr:hypothetical protein PPERSA_07770 [Pseudocohnilembus persalinus]|eukprot:KRX11245.1 hypothetical protein PPERSA_07770 [Pseudocohnilembus persalinus]